MDSNYVNTLINKVETSIKRTYEFNKNGKLLLGVDLGTAYIVLVVLDENMEPIACQTKAAEVVRDGLVLDYMGALNAVKDLKGKLEKRLGMKLTKAAIAIPPGTSKGDSKTHKYVVEGAGLEVVNILDEPTAANSVLQIENGAIVDIGGGTTGVSILKDGNVIDTGDEATGGIHLSLVISGNYKISLKEAEKLKRNTKKQKEILPIVTPVIEKISTIISDYTKKHDVDKIYLVGGTSCLHGIEDIIEKETKISTIKPQNPFLVTPLGIAMNCLDEEWAYGYRKID